MKLSIRLAALDDMSDAFEWYEEQRPELGEEFLLAVDEAIARIQEHPMRFRVLLRDTRQALLKRFPYRLLYRILADEIVVVACFHASRSPRRWEERR